MTQLLAGSIILSLLHALIPSHWLPVLAIGRTERWSVRELTNIAFYCAFAHAFSTVLIGIGLGLAGRQIAYDFESVTRFLPSVVFIFFGLYFLYQHYRHHHFHIHRQPDASLPKSKVIAVLVTTMFFSPCLEIEGYFLVAGTRGIGMVLLIALIYIVLGVGGMVLWIRWAYTRSENINWHPLEHNAGIITGVTLIATGVISFFVR
jgi:nickel/cobalt exporter